ncbi:MAG: L-fucose:H+ symporter permease [Dysgonamonadaceae bacterium]|nr:L-fucose:H+ symporter permease [Dysgonamonadaceae bacterium]MDD3355422.1 L-fucose:H+ symporter permease [Dysgonamonadaceae bacterium]MDD3727207.1 L-fucose:H+ symporter permease [Dysgonamonadaceae bacterium]MDD4605480.1 L-fucose:H+ symporter permease [Dysgonamonadaceae bacterium]
MNNKNLAKHRLVPAGIIFPFILLTALFFIWAVPNNMTDTMLAAFKRIMSLNDTQTAWIQVVCYLLGYGFFAIPGAIFIKKHTYKSGVLLGLGLCITGAILFYPAMLANSSSSVLSFGMYLLALLVLFAGLSILETSTNSYVYALGDPRTATRRLNFSQSFNPFGALTGVLASQIFVLSQLNTMSAFDRASLLPAERISMQNAELNAVTNAYLILGLVMLVLFLLIFFTRMPKAQDDDKNLNLKATFKRLKSNKNYVWGVMAQFFYVGAQIAVWSFIIRYAMQQLNFDSVIASLGENPSSDAIIVALRGVEPVAGAFYSLSEWLGLDVLLPRTAEQAGATYYIMSLVLFVSGRFICTWLMKYIRPVNLLSTLAVLAVICSITSIYASGFIGIYALMGISGCMSLMFPTIYGLGMRGLGEDTKLGGSGMVMAIAGAAVLTQLQGVLSDQSGDIKFAYWVPAIAFVIIAYYSFTVARNKKLQASIQD